MADKYINATGLATTRDWVKGKLEDKAELSVASISTAGGGDEVHATVSQGDDSVSLNYYKTGATLPDYVNLNISGDGFRLPTAGYVDKLAVPFIANYGQTTYADVTAAIDADRAIVVNFANNKNLICVTYATYAAGQNVTMSGIYKYGSGVSLAEITLTPENAWSIAHTAMQEALESGTNIKTFNGESLLGSGNIDVGGGVETFVAEYGVTTYDELQQAILAGKIIYMDTSYDSRMICSNGRAYTNKISLIGMVANNNPPEFDIAKLWFFTVDKDNNWAYESMFIQERLVGTGYGQNIKTINNQSLLGSGNIDIPSGGTVDTAMSDTSENAVQNKVIKSYVDGATGDLSTLTTDNKTNLVSAINEVYEKSGEPFRVKNWAASGLNVSIPYCTEDLDNTSIPKMDFSISDEEGAAYQVVGMVAYEVKGTDGKRINCWPVCQFTGNGQKTLSVRWMCAGTSRKTAAAINAWVLLKHR